MYSIFIWPTAATLLFTTDDEGWGDSAIASDAYSDVIDYAVSTIVTATATDAYTDVIDYAASTIVSAIASDAYSDIVDGYVSTYSYTIDYVHSISLIDHPITIILRLILH